MNTLTICPICGYHKFKQFPRSLNDVYFIQCELCGEFEITEECIISRDTAEKINKVGYILSGLSRELYENDDKRPTFKTTNIDSFIKSYPVPDITRIEEKIKKLLQYLKAKTEYFGQGVELGDIETVIPLAYAKNGHELIALFTLMTEKNWQRLA